jgi:hypothetical protein
MTLLNDAKAVKPRKTQKKQEEEMELALGWLKDEVSYVQAQTALKCRGSSVYVPLARGIREAFRRGQITVNQNRHEA